MTISRLTNSADDSTWVDVVPGPAESGYTAQNTNITARSRGMDSTTVEAFGAMTVRIKAGGVVDVDGVPYLIGADEDLGLATSDDAQYIALVDAGATEKTAAIVAGPVTWNAAKNVFETAGGDRVLDWRISAKDSQAVATHIDTPPDSARDTAPGGISRGGTYIIHGGEGARGIPVMHSGLYEVFAIGAGAPEGASRGGGGGGGCATAHVRLNQGETLTVGVGTLVDTSITLGTELVLTGHKAIARDGGGATVSGTRSRVWENTTTGGDGANGGGTSSQYGDHAGGAGPRQDGLWGHKADSSDEFRPTMASRFEGAGEGGVTTTGTAVIRYMSI